MTTINTKYFTTTNKSARRVIIHANKKNPMFNNSDVIAHCYPRKSKVLVLLHERSKIVDDKSYKINPRYKDKATNNEKYSKRFELVVTGTNAKDIEKSVNNAIKALCETFDERIDKAIEIEREKSAKSEKSAK